MLRVLIIEDSADDAELVELQLAKGGYQVAAVRIASETAMREALAGAEWDVIIADYHLDSSDGVAAIRGLRERFERSTPAILVTADRSAAVRAQAHAKDVQVLNKPLKPAALRALLAQWRIQRVAAAE